MKPSGRLSALLTERRVVLGVLAAFAIWSLVPLVPLLEAVNDRGGVLTGTTGSDAYNQFQYLAWMRDAGRHILISNPFGLTPVHHDFLQPMYVVSGLLNRAGLDIRYAYLIWRPVAIVVLVLSFALYTRRLMGESRMAWLAALLLALFYFTPLLTFLGRIGEFEWGGGFDLLIASREVSASRLTWGADHTAISVALMPLFLLSLERVLARGRLFGREVALAAALGLFTSWLHPAQGGTLFFIVVGLMIAGRLQRRYWSLLVPLAAAGAPLLYFKILTWTDAAWEIASQTSAYPHLPLLPLALGIGPLLLFSLLGLPRRFPASERERMLLIWPLAALIVYIVNEQFPPHAFNGLSLPLAILAVRGWSRLRLPALAGAAALAIAIVPAMTDPIGPLRRAVQYGGPLYLLTDDQYAGL